jgi:hypothetical protein
MPEREARAVLGVFDATSLGDSVSTAALIALKQQEAAKREETNAEEMIPDAYYLEQERQQVDQILALDYQTNLSQFVVLISQMEDRII